MAGFDTKAGQDVHELTDLASRTEAEREVLIFCSRQSTEKNVATIHATASGLIFVCSTLMFLTRSSLILARPLATTLFAAEGKTSSSRMEFTARQPLCP